MTMSMTYFFPTMTFSKTVSIRLLSMYNHRITEVWNIDNISELERLISIRIIQEDTETISSLMSSERDSIFAMEVIPYYALFVQSCQEYMGKDFLSEEIALNIKDIRNHIKSYAESFGKSKRKVASIDQEQDMNFRSKLRFNFLKSWNIHLNLGTYWTEDHHIIGNTQQLAAFIDAKDLSDSESGKKLYDLGYQIGSFVSSVRSGLSERPYPIWTSYCQLFGLGRVVLYL